MKKDVINKLRGMHSHHVGAYFKIYHLCREMNVAQIEAENIAQHLASYFIPHNVSMRYAKIQQEALALDVALTALEKVNLVFYELDRIVINELYKKPIERNEKLIDALGGVWSEWIEYKQSNKPYKTAKTELIAYNQLMKSCSNDEQLASSVILNAISRQWVGFNVDVYLEQQSKLKNQSNDSSKIGRISRQDLYEWIDKE
jgi:hypothetical protein